MAEYFKNERNIEFVFVGDGASKERLQELVRESKISNVRFLPYQLKEGLNLSLCAADIHLITSRKGLAGLLVPSKVYGILACGRPFLAWIDKDSEISSIANNYKCGFIIPPGDVKGMIGYIDWVIKNPDELVKMGKNGRQAAVNYFDRKISTAKFNQMLENIDA